MQEKHLFEYAVIRFVPRVEREEFQNVGVVLFCKSQSFLKAEFVLDDCRLKSFYNALDLLELRTRLCVFDNICRGGVEGGTIGKMPPAERFRWLTSTRSTIVQTSAVHPGLCINAEATIVRLMNQLVH